MMKCKWCGVEVFFERGELGGGMIVEKETDQYHRCKPFIDWLKSVKLNGPTLSYARYQLWLMGPTKARKRSDIQEKTNQPLLPSDFFSHAKIVEAKP